MGTRRTLANNGRREPKESPVETSRLEWTVAEARDLFHRQGYQAPQVEKLTSIPERAFNPPARRQMARKFR